MPFLIYARYQPVPAQTKIQRHTECAYYFGFLVRQYSYLDAIHYNTLIKSQHPTFPPHRGSKGVGTPRVPFLIYARYQHVPAQTKIQRHTECAYYFGFLVRQYSYLDAIGYNTLIQSELSDLSPHRGSKGVGTPRVPFLIYARYQHVPAQTKVVGTRSVATTLDSWLGNILTSMPFITTL